MAMHDDVDQRREAKRASLAAKKEKAERDAAVSLLLTSPQGRRYLYWILEVSGAVGVNPFSSDSLVTAFRCGEQNIGQQVMAHIIDVSPEGFMTMLIERENERKLQVEKETSDEDAAG